MHRLRLQEPSQAFRADTTGSVSAVEHPRPVDFGLRSELSQRSCVTLKCLRGVGGLDTGGFGLQCSSSPRAEDCHDSEANIEECERVRDKEAHVLHTTGNHEEGARAVCAPRDRRARKKITKKPIEWKYYS